MQLFPTQASSMAGRVDAVYFTLILISGLIALTVFVLVVYFAVKYRSGADVDRTNPLISHTLMETSWIVGAVVVALGMFTWAAGIYFDMFNPPTDALEVYVVGKQWMWKIQHPGGQREINKLHVPVGQPVRLIMTSEDVIHSFYVPAFRVKMDVVPGKYTSTWFEATKTGEYHLFCAEYCGTSHSEMVGTVIAMEPSAYETWLATAGGPTAGNTMPASGEQLFNQLGCAGCHIPDGSGAGPPLQGVFGSQVELQSGQTVTADESYVRESILNPSAKVVAGYDPIMPSFQGQVTEDQIVQLIGYVKSLGQPQEQQSAPTQTPAAGSQ